MEMAATGGYSWADLDGELLVSMATAAGNGLSLRDYTSLRGVCTAWRSALPPPYPCVLSLADDRPPACPSLLDRISFHSDTTFDGHRDFNDSRIRNRPFVGNARASVFSLPLRRSFHLGVGRLATASTTDDRRFMDFHKPSSVADSGNGRASVYSPSWPRSSHLDMATASTMDGCRFMDFPSCDLVFGSEIRRVSTESCTRTRVVGSGNGRFAVAIDQGDYEDGLSVSFWTARILVLCPRTGKEVELVPLPRKGYQCVRKIVLAPDQNDATVAAMCFGEKIAYIGTSSGDDMSWTAVDVGNLVDLVFDEGGNNVYFLDSCGAVRVLVIPRGGRNKTDEPSLAILSVPGTAVFAPPYDAVSKLTFTKHVFFCHGSMYQMWQNTIGRVNLSNGFTMSGDEIFVLRYDPWRCPCWNVVKDLEGFSVFIGKNSSPAVVRATGGAVPGVRPNCLYWINSQCVPMVCDVATGTSKPCVDLRHGPIRGSTCWYFDDTNMKRIKGK